MEYNEINIKNIAKYIKSGQAVNRSLKLGIEAEHFVVDQATDKSVNYSEKNGVYDILEMLSSEYTKKIFIDGNFLGLSSEYGDISLEPAAQLEISLPPSALLKEIQINYEHFLNCAIKAASKAGRKIVSMGYHPKSKINDLELIPKLRYKYMSEHMSKRGNFSLNMMKGSCSTQISIDYTDEKDFYEKIRLANCLSPVIAFMCDNTPYFEGSVSPLNMMRARIWDSVDPIRSGLIDEALDNKFFGYEDYAKILYRKPALMTHKNNKVEYTADIPLCEIFKSSLMEESDIEYALGMFFPDVRVKKYIEIRMADAMPEKYMLSYAALIKGIFYNDENRRHYLTMYAKCTAKDIKSHKHELYNNDKNAVIFGQNIYEFCSELCQRAYTALGNEVQYIKPFISAMKCHKKIYEM